VGVFEFIIALVIISTAGKVVSRRFPARDAPAAAPQLPPGEIEGIRDTIDDLNGRVVRLEEERDFYKELLDAPERQRKLQSPEAPGGGSAGPAG